MGVLSTLVSAMSQHCCEVVSDAAAEAGWYPSRFKSYKIAPTDGSLGLTSLPLSETAPSP